MSKEEIEIEQMAAQNENLKAQTRLLNAQAAEIEHRLSDVK